jgi:hypothetical protein
MSASSIGDVNREVVAQVVVQVVASNFPILAGKAATTNETTSG